MEQVMLGVDGTLANLQTGKRYQPKWDGNRVKLQYENGRLAIINRRGYHWTEYVPEITEALNQLIAFARVESFVLDGELVVFKDGHSNLRLSNSRCAMRNKSLIQVKFRRLMPLDLMLFDIMEWDGVQLEHETFDYRTSVLRQILNQQVQIPKLHLTPTYEDPNKCWTEWVIKRKEEGVMIKDPVSPYVYDRSQDWIKVKIREKATFNVCGYTCGDGRRADLFGALIIMDDHGRLKGRCGGGFTDEEAERILHVLKQAPHRPQPFPESEVGMPYTAVDTPMKVEVAYQNCNYDSGKLRSPQLVSWWVEK